MTRIINYYTLFVQFLIRIKAYISACIQNVFDFVLNHMVVWLCRHYQSQGGGQAYY